LVVEQPLVMKRKAIIDRIQINRLSKGIMIDIPLNIIPGRLDSISFAMK